MTGSFCANCGAQAGPGASFCASCGAQLAAAPAQQPPQAPPTVEQPAAPAYQAAPSYPDPQEYQGQQHQPGFQPPQQPWVGGPTYSDQHAQPAPAPWGAAPAMAPPQPTAPRRSLVDSLLTGDWGGAARSAGLAVGVMLAISLLGMLLVTEGGIGFRETIALVFAGVCLAVGGDFFAEADAESFGASASLGLLPLTVTLAGLCLLGWSFARQLRNRSPVTASDDLLQGVRTALVFTACFLPLSLLTRYETEEFNALGLVGQLGVGVVSSVFSAFLFAVAALWLTWFLRRGTAMPGRVAAFRDTAIAPLVGAVAVFSVGLLAVLVGLVYLLLEEGDKAVTLGVALLGGGNGALLSVLLSAGVPLDMEGSASIPITQFAPIGATSVDLFTFTDESAWFWLAPVALLAVTVLVATALAVRQNTIEDARREGARFAGALALVAFVATLLLRVGAESEAGEFDASADGSLMFNPLLAAVVLGIWGIVTGLLAPVVAAKMPSGFVMAVRRRFGAAPDPVPPAQY